MQTFLPYLDFEKDPIHYSQFAHVGAHLSYMWPKGKI